MDKGDDITYQPATRFDAQKAGDNYRIAVLPIVYERALNEGASAEEARALVASRMQAGDSFEIVRHQNTTAIVVHQPSSGKITVAFDGTEEFRDRMANLNFLEHDHPLGGKVHSGHFNAIALEDDQGRKISSRVKAIVERYAASGEGVSELTMTGHSRGGALSVATTAEWMSEGMPARTHLADVQTFGALPYGNTELMQNFMSESAKQGTRVTRVIAGNDEVPTYMASPKWTSKMFTHGGDAVYLLPAQDDKPASVLINPDSATLQAARQNLPKADWHHPDSYAELLGVQAAKLPPGKPSLVIDVSPSELQYPPTTIPKAYSKPRGASLE